MGLRQAPARSTLADALASRDWRIYFEFAQRLIAEGTGSRLVFTHLTPSIGAAMR
jgi:hypothetical protein